MCRHAAAIGPPIALSSILVDTPHSLHEQSYRPRELLTGTVCADGYGVAWYDADVRPEPARYVAPVPIWSDVNVRGVGDVVHSTCLVAAVRNATVPGANTQANCAPFTSGRHALSLNGYLERFEDWRDTLPEWIAPGRRRLVKGTADSEWLFQALLSLLDELDPEPGALANAIRSLLSRIDEAARRLDAVAQVNLLVTDGSQVVATRWSTQEELNSLYTLVDGHRWPGSTLIASEPLDDDAWRPVDPGSVVVAKAGAPLVRLRA